MTFKNRYAYDGNTAVKKRSILAKRIRKYFSFFGTSGNQLTYTQNWYFTEITLNPGVLSRYSNETIAHEMGHAFGLRHANRNSDNVMCQTGSGRIVQRPQEVDDAVVRNIYR